MTEKADGITFVHTTGSVQFSQLQQDAYETEEDDQFTTYKRIGPDGNLVSSSRGWKFDAARKKLIGRTIIDFTFNDYLSVSLDDGTVVSLYDPEGYGTDFGVMIDGIDVGENKDDD